MGAVHTYIGLPTCVLHHRAAYLEGRGAIDLLLDSGGASSRVGLPSIWDEAISSTCRGYIDWPSQNFPPRYMGEGLGGRTWCPYSAMGQPRAWSSRYPSPKRWWYVPRLVHEVVWSQHKAVHNTRVCILGTHGEATIPSPMLKPLFDKISSVGLSCMQISTIIIVITSLWVYLSLYFKVKTYCDLSSS